MEVASASFKVAAIGTKMAGEEFRQIVKTQGPIVKQEAEQDIQKLKYRAQTMRAALNDGKNQEAAQKYAERFMQNQESNRKLEDAHGVYEYGARPIKNFGNTEECASGMTFSSEAHLEPIRRSRPFEKEINEVNMEQHAKRVQRNAALKSSIANRMSEGPFGEKHWKQ